jgi:hypothetical protein
VTLFIFQVIHFLGRLKYGRGVAKFLYEEYDEIMKLLAASRNINKKLPRAFMFA